MLNAPDYTRTCSCSYQNQTSLALISMPDVEIWTWSDLPEPSKDETLHRVGINLGAPGNRLSDEGVYWINYPSVGGPSPDISVKVEPKDARWFRQHSSQVVAPTSSEGGGLGDSELRWVASCGVEGARKIEVTVNSGDAAEDAKKYRVRLFFYDPEQQTAEQRMFGITLQGKAIREQVDVVRDAGGPRRLLTLEAPEVEIAGKLTIELEPTAGSVHPAVLCGIEIVFDETS